jgi:hypothetical protein
MDAFESVISMLLRHDGYWTIPSFKVQLTREDKLRIKNRFTPRREIDLIAYKGSTNEVLAVECKSFFDSRGVTFKNGHFERASGYKLFEIEILRKVVLRRLARQLVKAGHCPPKPKIKLCLAAGHIASGTKIDELQAHFDAKKWRLFDREWMSERLTVASEAGYENDVAFVVSKLLLRK